MLEAVGLSPQQERVYAVLIDHPRSASSELVTSTGMSPSELDATLAAMEQLGLVSRTTEVPPRYVPAPPDVAVEALIAKLQEGLERARLEASHLLERYRQMPNDPGSASLVEVLQGRGAVGQRFYQIRSSVKEELLILDKPPYGGSPDEVDGELWLLDRGATVRTIYERSALERSDTVDHIRQVQARGEAARLLPQLPLKLAIADRRVALVPLVLAPPTTETFALVHPCALLDALVALFDTLWHRAVPLDPAMWSGDGDRDPHLEATSSDRLTAPEAQLLGLLLAGYQDTAIARRLGVTTRTVSRKVAHLMQRTGSQTRFQLGWHAAERGWLAGSDPTDR